MKKSALWDAYCEKNPSFLGDGNVTLSCKGLRKLFDQTWDYAYYEGEGEDDVQFPSSSSTVNDLMSIFGMK